jgi:hypothetical protein
LASESISRRGATRRLITRRFQMTIYNHLLLLSLIDVILDVKVKLDLKVRIIARKR